MKRRLVLAVVAPVLYCTSVVEGRNFHSSEYRGGELLRGSDQRRTVGYPADGAEAVSFREFSRRRQLQPPSTRYLNCRVDADSMANALAVHTDVNFWYAMGTRGPVSPTTLNVVDQLLLSQALNEGIDWCSEDLQSNNTSPVPDGGGQRRTADTSKISGPPQFRDLGVVSTEPVESIATNCKYEIVVVQIDTSSLQNSVNILFLQTSAHCRCKTS
jgi:hypothetical protein